MYKLLSPLLHKFTHVQALSPRHAAAISHVHGLCFPARWSEDDMQLMLNDYKVQGAGVFLWGILLGFVLSRTAADEAEILTIATHPWAQGLGVGRELLRYNFLQLARHQAQSLFLEVATENTAALKLYRSLGFQEVGRRKAYYQVHGQPPKDALILRRPIEPSPHYVHGYAGGI